MADPASWHSHVYFDAASHLRAEAVGDPAGYMLGKTCLEKGLSPTHNAVTDAAFDMKAFVAAK